MTAPSAASVLLIAAAVVWILARQIRLEPVKPWLLALTPVLLGYLGLRQLPTALWQSAVAVALFTASAAVSVGLGVWRGRTIRVWQDADGVWWRQGSRVTLLLWGALFAVRGVLLVVDHVAGSAEASGVGALLCALALSFGAQNAVIALRMTAPATRPAAPVPAR